MHKQTTLLLLFFCPLLFPAAVKAEPEQKLPPKSLVIMLDGARADAMLMGKTPNLDSLRSETWAEGYKGAWSFAAHTIKDAATVSAQNHTAIATGAAALKTKVSGNNVYNDYNKTGASAVYKTFLTRIKERFPEKKTAFVYEWKPDKTLVPAENPYDFVFNSSDKENAKTLAAVLGGSYENGQWEKGSDVDAVLCFIDLPDSLGHSGGYCPPGKKHKEYLNGMETIDQWLGSCLEAIKSRPHFADEDWQIIITSDHGGWLNLHGPMRSDCYTIPFILSGKDIVSGEISGQPCNADAAATTLAHFGFDVVKMKEEGLIDGTVRGKAAAVPPPEKPLEDGLLAYFPFDSNLENKVSAGNITAENHGGVLDASGGKHGGFLQLRKAEQPQYAALGNPPALQTGTDGNFSIAFWLRLKTLQEGDPVLIGNKNWKSGANPGFSFFVTPLPEHSGNLAGFNIGNDSKVRVDVKQIFIPLDEWQFCAVTVNRSGNVTLFSGNAQGQLFFVSESLIDENVGKSFGRFGGSVNTALSWNIGQDGTGLYVPKLDGDIDELRIWNRALCREEIEAVFKK